VNGFAASKLRSDLRENPTKTPGAANTGGKGIVSIAMRGGPLNKIAPKSPIGSAKGQTAKPVAAPPPDPFAGLERLGNWALLKSDSVGKRAIAKCVGCGAVHQISIVDGIQSCGCAESRRPAASGFVHDLVEIEARVASRGARSH
jgi:hypothetical protein